MLPATKDGLEKYVASHLGLNPDDLTHHQREVIATIIRKMDRAAAEELAKLARELMRP